MYRNIQQKKHHKKENFCVNSERIKICRSAKSIRRVSRTLEHAIISRNRLDRTRRPNVNIPMVIDLRPVFGAKPKASPTLGEALATRYLVVDLRIRMRDCSTVFFSFFRQAQ